MQPEQALISDDSVLGLYVPAGQLVQAVDVVDPVLMLYLPAGQLVQTDGNRFKRFLKIIGLGHQHSAVCEKPKSMEICR